MKKTTFAFCALLSATGYGNVNGALAGSPNPKDRSAEVRAVIASQDLAAIKRICADDSLPGPNESSRGVPIAIFQANRNARADACREAAILEADKQADGDCTTIVDRYAKAHPADGERGYGFWVKWGKRMAACDNYEAIFEQLAHVGDLGESGDGVLILQQLEEQGVALKAGLAKYAASAGANFLDSKNNDFAANHIRNWLVLGKHFDLCPVLAKTLAVANEDVRAGMLAYFTEAKCHKDGVALGLSLLTSATADHRRRACANLSNTGDTAVLKKVQILAASDNYSEVQEKRGNDGRVYAVKVFPVRDACSAAAGQIQLRAN